MFFGWWIVVLMFIAGAFCSATIWYGFTAFFEPLVEEFGWSHTAISFAASFRGAEHGLMAIAVGFLLDKWGSRKVIFFGSLLICIGFLMLSRVNTLYVLYISFVIISIGATGFDSLVGHTLVARWFHRRVGLALGIVGTGMAAGSFCLPGIVYLIDAIGFRLTYFIFGIMAIIIGTITALFVRNRPQDLGYGPDGIPLNETQPSRKISESQNSFSQNEYTFKQAISTLPFWIVTYVCSAYLIGVITVITHVMPYLEFSGYSRYSASLIALAFPLMSIIGRLSLGWSLDMINPKLVLILATVGQITGLVLFAYAHVVSLLIASVIIYGTSWGGFNILRVGILRYYYGTHSIGSILGLCFGLSSFISMIGPVVGGWIYDTTGSYYLVWLILAIPFVIAMPLVLLMKDKSSLHSI